VWQAVELDPRLLRQQEEGRRREHDASPCSAAAGGDDGLLRPTSNASIDDE
jgi:hypothetical protein